MVKIDSGARKKIAVNFLELIISGKIDEAYQKYVDMKGKHHNTFTPAGFPALKKGMADNDAQFPNKEFKIKHILGDDDLVAVHSQLILKKEELELITIHLLRFKGDKIVELWDVAQKRDSNSPNKDGDF